jgi:hypothetical protein
MSSSEPERRQDNSDAGRWSQSLGHTSFTRLLVALSVLLFASPFIGSFGNQLGELFSTLLVVVLLSSVLVASALAVSESRRQSRVTLILAAACVVLTWLGNLTDSSSFRVSQQILTIGFLAHVVRLIVRAQFRQRSADHDTIAASICGYLLIGVAFAVVYSLVIQLDASAFDTGEAAPGSQTSFHFGNRHTFTSLYYSFVTLTTLGFGDITPVSMPARMLTTAEALIGQLYLVVLVARLVGLHISNGMTQPTNINDNQE